MTKRNHKLFSCMLVFSILGFFFSTFFCLAAYLKYVENQDGAFGTVGLRSYFHCGTGSEEDPYVITRPRHLYNLSHLQALGVFSEKKYFQLGYDLEGNGNLEFYKSDSTSDEYSTVLDMNEYKGNEATTTITSIGSEATPFYGVFEGNGLTIKNLTVDASLEDSGLFGYTASRSLIENFILDEVTIKNDGYSDDLKGLYSSESDLALKKRSSFTVKQDDAHKVIYGYDESGNSKINEGMTGDSTNKVSFDIYYPDKDADGSKYYYNMPTIDFGVETKENDSFTYTLLSSDVFFTKATAENGTETLTLNEYDEESKDLTDIFSYFDSYKKENLDDTTTETDIVYPLTLSMTVSLVANYVDSSSICHSKVVAALNISFEKLLKDSKFITMYVQPRETQHENNMGLVIGHCDGSCKNVYVHNGYFKMNSNNQNTAVSQNSMTGFIGLIGPSVNNSASTTAKGNIATTGKDVGVLDFTDIYTSIVGESPTFTSIDDSYYTYEPNQDSENQYMEYLRFKDSSETKKYTKEKNSIALIGQKTIKDDETHNRGLGVFTVATNYQEGGNNQQNVYLGIDKSNIVKSKLTTTKDTKSWYDSFDSKNIFYSTYEYKKENVSTIYPEQLKDKVWNSISASISDPSTISDYYSPGYHMPEESTVSSMDVYEAYYNYLFRFQLDKSRSSFYFSDLAKDSIGGKFLNNYFSHILVDEEGKSIPVGSSQFGLMIKNKKKQNISELTTNFKLDNSGSMYVFGEDDSSKSGNKYTNQTSYVVSNSINFEIKTDMANVTILASNNETSNSTSPDTGSMLGVYKLPETLISTDSFPVPCDSTGSALSWDNPDYAMALPANKAISFYQYKNDGSTGQIGRKSLSGSDEFSVVQSDNNSSIFVNTSNDSAYICHPIFAHTFKLPRGRYCLGSALGSAHVYYICAQGQDEGDISLAANVYSKINVVENMDFIKSATAEDDTTFFSIDKTTGIISTTDALKSNRLYIILDSGNVSHFNASTKNNTYLFELNMKYENDQFVFSIEKGSDLSSVSSIAITNYGGLNSIGSSNASIKLFENTASTNSSITYTYKG